MKRDHYQRLRPQAWTPYDLLMPPVRILHVEDDPDDAFFFSRAIKNAIPGCRLHREVNGEGAIAYLRGTGAEGEASSPPIPDLMVLDLKLPGLSGFEVLAWTRAKPAFETLPIIVLSGSSLVQDRNKAFTLRASDFIVKHSDYDHIAGQVAQFIVRNGLAVPSPSYDP